MFDADAFKVHEGSILSKFGEIVSQTRMRRDEPPRFRDEGGKVHNRAHLAHSRSGGERPFAEPNELRSALRGRSFINQQSQTAP